MDERRWRIGEVAQATGLSARTLRYYEDAGLVTPSGRLSSGHRVYSGADIVRLYRVGVLRRLDRPVAEIPALLANADDLRATVAEHLDDLDRRLAELERQRGRVLAAQAALAKGPIRDTELLSLLDGLGDPEGVALRPVIVLVYADLAAAHRFLVEVFGFQPGPIQRDGSGRVVHAEVRVGDRLVWLHPASAEYRLAAPGRVGATTHAMAVLVDDVDRHADRVRAAGAEIVTDPRDEPYGYREYDARDCEGGLWSFMSPIPDEGAPR